MTGSGLVASPAPGSIFAYMAMTPRGGHLGVLLGILVAAVVSFVVAALLLGLGRGEKVTDPDDASGTAAELDTAKQAVADRKQAAKAGVTTQQAAPAPNA